MNLMFLNSYINGVADIVTGLMNMGIWTLNINAGGTYGRVFNSR